MKKIKTYQVNFIGNSQRKRTEKKLLAEGYKIDSEEEFKKRTASGCAILFLLVIFAPLALLCLIQSKFVRVTYIKD